MDEFVENKKIVDERKKLIEERKRLNTYKQQLFAQQRLEKNLSKKIQTTMSGALESFENGFGDLWGIDLDENTLDPEQARLSEIWEDVRSEILNRGNMQIRAAKDEISEYNTEWNGRKINFILKEKDND